MNVLRMLASQNRLLIDGIAGSGKTHLAMTLAEQHAQQNKRVLLTCYNRYLAAQLAQATAHIPNIKAIAFHDLVKEYAELAGLAMRSPKTLLI
jgi:signal recognition particle GTPase